MSQDVFQDTKEFCEKMGLSQAVGQMSAEDQRRYMTFRLTLLREELGELVTATLEKNPEEQVDALIDLMVVALVTLQTLQVDPRQAWDQVLSANMTKVPGIKPGRPNEFNMPDLKKPEGWKAPDHSGNYGLLTNN